MAHNQLLTYYNNYYYMGGSRGGVSGVATPPNGQSHNIKCCIKLGSQYDARPCIALCRAGEMQKNSISTNFS